MNKLNSMNTEKYNDLKARNMLDPTMLEKLMGIICILCLIGNLYYKWHTMTLIFMFNPCHVVCLSLAIISFSKFSTRVELLALFVFSSAFGGWIGLIWSENDEMSVNELLIYYTEHLFTSFMGTVVLSLSGRFDPLHYFTFPLQISGFHLFVAYMRYVLTPLSQLTWANLNHTLCGVDNDPFYKGFDLGYSYYFWADFYLLGGCIVTIIVNCVICFIFKTIFSPCCGS